MRSGYRLKVLWGKHFGIVLSEEVVANRDLVCVQGTHVVQHLVVRVTQS